jgi:hypothetical protein
MSTFDDDYGTNSSDNGPKALREALEKSQEQNKALAARLEKFEQKERTESLGKALESKGLNPKIAGLIPADADPEKWVEQFGDLFAAATPGDDQGAASGAGDEASTTVTEADQSALSTISAVTDTAQAGGDAAQAVKARLASAKSSDEVLAIMVEAGLA